MVLYHCKPGFTLFIIWPTRFETILLPIISQYIHSLPNSLQVVSNSRHFFHFWPCLALHLSRKHFHLCVSRLPSGPEAWSQMGPHLQRHWALTHASSFLAPPYLPALAETLLHPSSATHSRDWALLSWSSCSSLEENLPLSFLRFQSVPTSSS